MLIEESEDYCIENEIFVGSITKQLTKSVIFENIIAGCSYELSINNNNQHIYVKNYTVPDCVGTKCICHYKSLPNKPIITCEQLSMNEIRITWKISKEITMTNISTLHIRVIHIGNPNPVVPSPLNLTPKCLLSGCHMDVTVPGMMAGAHYKIESWYSNTINCTSARRYLPFVVQSIKEPQIVFQVLISMMFVIMVLVLSWLVWKKRCGCLPTDILPPNTLVTRNNRSTSNSANLNKKFPVPMVDNHIYTEREIEEEQQHGTVDKYEIGYKLLQLDRLIGGGAFGQVYKSTTHAIPHVSRNTPVAVKTLKTNASNDELEEFLREITMLKQIGNHPNIVTLLGCCTLRQPYCMVMEYIPCGDLLRYLHALRTYYERCVNHSLNNNDVSLNKEIKHTISDISSISPPSILLNRLPSVTKMEYTDLANLNAMECVLNPQDLQTFAEQIAQGMRHLESKQIVHRDLAARNVLVDENKVLKISDFGLSRRGIYVNSKQSKVPLRWLSVEAIKDYLYTSKSDVWAYGIVLWEIGTLGGFPYPDVSNEKILEYLLNGKRLNKPENISADLYSLMERCWLLTIEDRPSFTDVLNELKNISSKRHVYVDFSQLNPTYMFPPKTELCTTNTNNTSDNCN